MDKRSALLHYSQAHVQRIWCHVLRGKAAAIVGNAESPHRVALHADRDLGGLGVLADVGQRLLHDVQHLHLHIGGQRQAFGAAHDERPFQAGLVLKLGQGGAQGMANVFIAGAGAKVHQQLAHIGVALAHAHLQFTHAAVAGGGVAFGNGIAQQLGLDF
jgi:hypothetical protein